MSPGVWALKGIQCKEGVQVLRREVHWSVVGLGNLEHSNSASLQNRRDASLVSSISLHVSFLRNTASLTALCSSQIRFNHGGLRNCTVRSNAVKR